MELTMRRKDSVSAEIEYTCAFSCMRERRARLYRSEHQKVGIFSRREAPLLKTTATAGEMPDGMKRLNHKVERNNSFLESQMALSSNQGKRRVPGAPSLRLFSAQGWETMNPVQANFRKINSSSEKSALQCLHK
jgi:hypothetical protein